MTTVPDGLPSLASGAHSPTEGKACVMEYVSVLAGERFSDRPSCTNRVIAAAARSLNDALKDEDRHLLVPLIPRIMSAGVDTDEVCIALAKNTGVEFGTWPYMAAVDAPYIVGRMIAEATHPLSRTTPWDAAGGTLVNVTPWFGYNPQAGIARFTILLNHYDELTGNAKPKELPISELQRVRELIESGIR